MSCFEHNKSDDIITVYKSNLHSDGVKVLKKINKDDVIFYETPMCCLQSIPNRQDAICCSFCFRFIGTVDMQLNILKKEITRQDVITYVNDNNNDNDNDNKDLILTDRIIPCQSNCGTLYCNENCRDEHMKKSHKYLCTGYIDEKDADNNCLFQFILHSIETNEIFLLVGDVYARILCDIDEGKSIENAMKPWLGYCRNKWEDVAKTNDTDETAVEFAETLKKLTLESWELLCDAFDLQSKKLDKILDHDFMSRTIGMFEQNNVGVRLTNPILNYIKKMDDDSELIESMLDNIKQISKNLESLDDVEWEDVEDDEENDDNDDNKENEIENKSIFVRVPTNPKLIELEEILKEEGEENIFPPLDGTAFYKTICKINHSCCPNCIVRYNTDSVQGLVAQVIALNEIEEGEELVQSYIDQSLDINSRQAALRDYGFECRCIKCTEEKTMTK